MNYTATPVTKTRIAWTNALDETVFTTSTVNPIVGDSVSDGTTVTEIDYDMVGVPSAIHTENGVFERDAASDEEAAPEPADTDSDSDTDTDTDTDV